MKFCHLQINEWNWRISSPVKLGSKTACFLSFVELDLIQIQYYEKAVTLRGGHT
jgi:hypothetical protein